MEAFRISVEVSVNLSENTQNFIKSLLGNAVVTTSDSAPVEKPKATITAAKPKATAPVAEAAAPVEKTKEAIPVEEPKEVAKPVEKPKEVAKPVAEAAAPKSKPKSIEDVRMMLAKKVNEHRDVIKQKLNGLGAPSVTKLDPAKYDEMFNFLDSL